MQSGAGRESRCRDVCLVKKNRCEHCDREDRGCCCAYFRLNRFRTGWQPSRWNRAACSGRVNADSGRNRRCPMLSTDTAPVFCRSNRDSFPATRAPRIFLSVSRLRGQRCVAAAIDPHRLAALAGAVVRHAGGAPGRSCDLAALDPVRPRSGDAFVGSLPSRRWRCERQPEQ